ncbi:MAG TPA: DUF5916 domain-containing protein [Gemmatimonadales bacterium]|nr:DUF5916 domain-containing protein [Gemmatimonadales bacterium]
MLLALIVALQGPPPDPAGPAFFATAPRLEASVTIDGELNEPVWSEAARLTDFHQYQPVDSRPAEEKTVVLVWYAPNAIHFGIIAYESQPGAIRATVADRDNLDADDRVTIYLDTFDDRRRAFFFTVNPLGSQEDGVRTEGGFAAGSLVGGTTDKNPDYIWESKGRLTDSGYVVEVRIPFKSLRYPGNGAQRWGINVVRKIQRTGYEDTWTDTRRANASFLVQSGLLDGLHDLQSGITTEFQPVVTAAANGAPTATGYDRENLDPSFGANLRLGLTSNLSVDATYNPDFSQIESDVSLVTVNERFALFFPEKRPFFLEGIELFSTNNQLVYTRQIIDPIAGGKVTSKIGANNLALLTAVDQAGPSDSWFNIARVRHDVGANSTVGVTGTSKDASGTYNRVVAGDARIVFGKLYFVAGQAGGSWTRDSAGGDSRSSPILEAEFDRTGRSWGFNYKVTGIGPDFESQAGFVPRNDIVQAHAFNRFSIYGSKGAFLETANFFGGPFYTWVYGDFLQRGALEGLWRADADFTLRGGWEWNNHGEVGFTNFEHGAYNGYQVDQGGTLVTYDAPTGVDNWSLQTGVTSPTWQKLDATLTLTRSQVPIFAEGSEGNETRVTGTLDLRPTGSVRISGSNTYSLITRRRDDSEFARTIIPRLKVEFQPTRAFFFRAVGEYVAQRRAPLEDADNGDPLVIDGQTQPFQESNGLRMDFLASFEPSPGTVAFLGYGSSLEDTQAFDFADMSRTSDGFFVKLAYQFRW